MISHSQKVHQLIGYIYFSFFALFFLSLLVLTFFLRSVVSASFCFYFISFFPHCLLSSSSFLVLKFVHDFFLCFLLSRFHSFLSSFLNSSLLFSFLTPLNLLPSCLPHFPASLILSFIRSFFLSFTPPFFSSFSLLSSFFYACF